MTLDSPQALLELANAFQKSRILLTAVELGVFSTLGDASRTAPDVALAIGADPRAVRRLLDALVVMGLLEKEGEVFRNGRLATAHLIKGRPGYMGSLGHTAALWRTWSTLTEAVRRGSSVMPPLESRPPDWFVDFIGAMHFRAEQSASALVAQLPLERVERVLDVGGGSGAFAIAFARALPRAEVTIFDLPPVIALAKGYVERAELLNRVRFREGDFRTEMLGGGYDLVFLSAVVHCLSPEGNVGLFEKCAAALNPGGRIVISDFIMDEARIRPPMGALFALNMLVGTESGDTFTASELESWLRQTGFGEIRFVDWGEPASLLIATRA